MCCVAGLLCRSGLCARGEDAIDVLEGKDITLKCHFNNPRIMSDIVLYWMRQRHGETDNVAIGSQALDANYRSDANTQKNENLINLNIFKVQNLNYFRLLIRSRPRAESCLTVKVGAFSRYDPFCEHSNLTECFAKVLPANPHLNCSTERVNSTLKLVN